MNDEELLQKVAEAVSHDDYLDDPRWQRLAAGELSEEEQSQLREELAARPDAPSARELDAAFETFKPLDTTFHRKIEALFPERPPAKEPWFSRLFGWPLVPAFFAGAAAVLVVILWPDPPASLPDYDLVFAGGDRQVRSGESEPSLEDEISRGSLLDLRLRPATRATDVESITLLAYLAGERIALPFRTAESGTVIVEGPVGELLPVPPGTYELILVVVREELTADVPTAREAIVHTALSKPWQVFVLPLTIVND